MGSQRFANLYLDILDHDLMDALGIEYYVRYMDDFVIIGADNSWRWLIENHFFSRRSAKMLKRKACDFMKVAC